MAANQSRILAANSGFSLKPSVMAADDIASAGAASATVAADSTIDSITVSYDSFGRPDTIESKDGSTVKNAVQMTYTDLWQIKEIFQEPFGAIDGQTKKVLYSYDTVDAGTADGNFSRPLSMTYPSGSVLSISYNLFGGGGNSSDYRISRPRRLSLDSQPVVLYDFIGMGMVASVDYIVPDVILDRSLAHNGTRTTGEYPGFDRFGRLIRHTWADGSIGQNSSDTTLPSIPPIVELGFSYDKASNITEKFDGRPGAQQNLDYQYIYDELDRLSEAKKGAGSGTGFTLAAGGQQWDLDVIGNWDSFDTDLNGDGLYQAANDRILAGGFNLANEISQLTETKQGGTPTALSYTYDKAGNLREQAITATTSYRYTHDAWNRLVKVEHVGTSSTTTRGEYEYNGLSQRCLKQYDSNIRDSTAAPDEQRVMYYSAGWQVLEEEVDDSWSSGHSTDRLVQNVWGMRYIDDLAIRRQDTDYSGTWGNTSSGDFTHYALSDHQFSVVALIDDSANLVERVSYSPYGEARHHWVADVDGDGDVDATDRSLLNTSYNKQLHQTNYNVHADFNRDGVVDSNDIPLVSPTNYVAALSPELVSSVGNVVGYAGYIFNDEISLYTVRFRCYDPATGRWLERDPAGYVDSMSLYGYGWGSPVLGNDPFGLDLLDDASNFFAGVGDALSFGITGMIRRGLGYDDVVDYNSTAYTAGEWTGIAVGFIGGVGAVRGTYTAFKQSLSVGGKLLEIRHVALVGGGTMPVLVENGQAIALSIDALMAAGYTAAQAAQIIQQYNSTGSGSGGPQLGKANGKRNPADYKTKPTKWWKDQGIDPHAVKHGFPQGDLVWNPKTSQVGFKKKGSNHIEDIGDLDYCKGLSQ